MSAGSTFIGWIAGGTGVVLLYSAYKNVSPTDVVRGTLTGDSTRNPIANPSVPNSSSSDTPSNPGGSGAPYAANTVPRAVDIWNDRISPTLVPIPTQPNLRMDIAAVASFMKVQAEYGKPIILSGTYKSAEQAIADNAREPNRFAAKSGHSKGIALDIDMNKVNVNDPKLFEVFSRNNWFRVGRSGPMHYSWGIGV